MVRNSWIACFRHALFAIDRSALPGCRGQARIRSDLASIVEVSEKSFRPEDGGEVRSNALDREQHGRRRRRGNLLRGKQRVPLGLHLLDLLEQQFEPIELTADLSLQMLWQWTAIARPQLVEPSPTVTTQRLRRSYQSSPAGADGMSQLRPDRRRGFRSLHSAARDRSRIRRGQPPE